MLLENWAEISSTSEFWEIGWRSRCFWRRTAISQTGIQVPLDPRMLRSHHVKHLRIVWWDFFPKQKAAIVVALSDSCASHCISFPFRVLFHLALSFRTPVVFSLWGGSIVQWLSFLPTRNSFSTLSVNFYDRLMLTPYGTKLTAQMLPEWYVESSINI